MDLLLGFNLRYFMVHSTTLCYRMKRTHMKQTRTYMEGPDT
jgi:hypothetical protein